MFVLNEVKVTTSARLKLCIDGNWFIGHIRTVHKYKNHTRSFQWKTVPRFCARRFIYFDRIWKKKKHIFIILRNNSICTTTTQNHSIVQTFVSHAIDAQAQKMQKHWRKMQKSTAVSNSARVCERDREREMTTTWRIWIFDWTKRK